MAPALKYISIALRPKLTNEYTDIVAGLINWLGRRGYGVNIHTSDAERLTKLPPQAFKNINFVEDNDLYKSSKMIISMGGDGTLIGCCRKAPKGSAPIFGINMGRLGFITEFSKINFYDYLELALKDKLEIEKIPLYQIKVTNKDKIVFDSQFINDAVISKNELSRMFVLNCEVGGDNVYNLAGDGLIISSPIGSTAYSLAAGGPIIHPSVKSLILNPICPHSLNHRPLVIPHDQEIHIRIRPPEENTILTLDGQQGYNISKRDLINIKFAARKYVRILKNPERTFFHTLKEKLTHGRRQG